MTPLEPPPLRTLLSVPHMSGREQGYIAEAFSTNWISTVGPHLPAFEAAMEERLGVPALALSSGTAAIHLGLRLLEAGPGDEVWCQSLTFSASANPILYEGATPVFLDSEQRSWNLDPDLLEAELRKAAGRGKLPKAVIVVHLFGQCADMKPILEACQRYGVPVLEDAAEALGSTYCGQPAGTFGDVAAISFNGNKIITTSGGGMLLSSRKDWIAKARFWSTQSREPGLAYLHQETGFNYRMSNVLAGIGRAQLEVLDERVAARRAIRHRYVDAFEPLEGLDPMPEAGYGVHTHWLSCFLVRPDAFGMDRDALIGHLRMRGIESRPVWKPMHQQPVFAGCKSYGGSVADDLFARGICLPSSSSLSPSDQQDVIEAITEAKSTNRETPLWK